MGFFKKLFGKKEATKPAPSAPLEHIPNVLKFVENQSGRVAALDYVVEDMLQLMFEDDEQFVTLSLPSPLYDGVKFVQACRIPDGIDVQIGIEENGSNKLVERICSEEECMRIFMDFFDTCRVEDIDTYTPVQRM